MKRHGRPAGPRRRWLLPGLAACLVATGGLALAAGCGTRATVSVIPPAVGTVPPPAPSSAAARAPAVPVPRVPPVRIVIPAIGVNAPVMQLGLNPDKTIQVPPLALPNLAGWYKYGPSPGQRGPAVIVGHIDSAATGAAVFFRLRYLTKGERVYVTLADRRTVTFIVDGLQQVPKTAFPTSRVYGPLPYAGLRLVTCGGVFNPAAGSYLSDVIVYAHLA